MGYPTDAQNNIIAYQENVGVFVYIKNSTFSSVRYFIY